MKETGVGEAWYCIRSKTKKERMAAEILRRRFGMEVFCPRVRFRRRTVRGAVWFEEALFPGYFFARFDLSAMRRAVIFSPGVLGLPTFNGEVYPLSSAFIASLRKEMKKEVVETGEPLQPGEETAVLEGPLQGMKVKILKLLPARRRAEVLMEMLGTLVAVEVPLDTLEQRRRHPLAAR